MPFDEDDNDQEKSLLAAYDRAEWALRLLEDGKHKRLKKYLSNLTANYRIVSQRDVLENAQSTGQLSGELIKASKAVGIIRGTIIDGEPVLNVIQFDNGQDPEGTQLLAASQRELRNGMIDALRQDIGKKPNSSLLSSLADIATKTEQS